MTGRDTRWSSRLTAGGMMKITPVEMMESRFPIMVERHALVPDSGGPGERRGGLGLEYVVRSQGEMNISTQVERVHCAPWGLEDGMAGNGNRVELIRDEQRVTAVRRAAALLHGIPSTTGLVNHFQNAG